MSNYLQKWGWDKNILSHWIYIYFWNAKKNIISQKVYMRKKLKSGVPNSIISGLPSLNLFFLNQLPLFCGKLPFPGEYIILKSENLITLNFWKSALFFGIMGEHLLVILLNNRFQVFYNKNIRPHLWQNCRIIMPFLLEKL